MSFAKAWGLLAARHPKVVDVAGVRCLVVRQLFGNDAVALLRETRARLPRGFAAILTGEGYVHEHYEPMPPRQQMTLASARRARRKIVAETSDARRVLRGIAKAKPQSQPYEERDSFLELPGEALALVVVKGSWQDAVHLFLPDGGGVRPRDRQTLAFLQHWYARCGAVPLFADGARLELEVVRPPQGLHELRATARDVFLLSQGVLEGFGYERPSRLLRRITSDRWVVWWYGT